MRRTLRAGAAGLAVALAAASAGCGSADPSPPTAADLEEIDLSVDHTLVVDDDGFDPARLDMIAGEVVRIVNEGEGVHSLTAEDRRFDTGRMQPGDDATLVLTEPGEVTVVDLTEPEHTATITVRPQG
jgi:plastocyanin